MRYTGASASERQYLPPAVAVSVVAFALQPPADAELGDPGAGAGDTTIWIPLVRRTRAPFLGQWALPGGPTQWDETLADTALRSLHAATQRTPGYLEQLYSFGGVERSAEAQRLVTIAYWALYGEHELEPEVSVRGAHGVSPVQVPSGPRRWDDPIPASGLTGEDAAAGTPAGSVSVANVAWFSADRLPELAFDHREIIDHALGRLRAKTEYASVAHRFLGPVFTLGRLRTVTEAVLGQPVDPANFRRQALAQGSLVDTGELESGARHRPARLYRFAEPPGAANQPITSGSTSARSRE
ncbi:Nudix-related transcriptional regulator NrtR [Leucobacter sp. 7(1)]|uniref:NUDIX hydrolase n=1 Tax=Leucobacter sp. 7(1) TaxID=1255613 RepID=UPI00097E83EE|nr:NUDIX domain-containing protein [Leucobacter sp. 7(1)]SJN07996.1 Nudix-related transcriptional regulator NrtR [Leucobacter sp. 7(1)]